MDEMQTKLLEAAIRMGVSLAPGPLPEASVITARPPQEEVKLIPVEVASFSSEPVDPPLMKPEWEKEIDEMIAQHNGRLNIPLPSGTMIRVVAEPKPADDAVEVSYETFKRLSRAAAILNAKVVNIVTKAQSDAHVKDLLDKGAGYWATPHIFIEVDKQSPIGGAKSSDFGVIAAPKQPPTPPSIDPKLWIALSASSVIEQIPMRVTGNKVVGTVIKTKNGPLFARVVKELDHKLNIRAGWAMAGGYTIERDAYDKYLTDPATVIKFVRGEQIYLTTSAWVQRYAGLIRHWGTERIVMPLSGNYWLVANKEGEIISQ